MFLSRTSFSKACTSLYILSSKFASISSYISWSTSKDLYSILGFPISAFMSEINLHTFLISSCPVFIASSILSSGNSFAPASIIAIFSIVPATVKSNSVFALSSSVGFITNLPST